jgi:hypothetical protein
VSVIGPLDGQQLPARRAVTLKIAEGDFRRAGVVFQLCEPGRMNITVLTGPWRGSPAVRRQARRMGSLELAGPTKRHHDNTLRAWVSIPVRVAPA